MQEQVALFHSKTLQVSVEWKHKLQATLPVLCWYLFKLNDVNRSEKRKMYDMNA